MFSPARAADALDPAERRAPPRRERVGVREQRVGEARDVVAAARRVHRVLLEEGSRGRVALGPGRQIDPVHEPVEEHVHAARRGRRRGVLGADVGARVARAGRVADIERAKRAEPSDQRALVLEVVTVVDAALLLLLLDDAEESFR